MKLLRIVSALLWLACASATAQEKLAPDGKRGFGVDASLSEILHVFRQPDDEDKRWLNALERLSGEIDTFVTLARDRCHKRGYVALLEEKADPDLFALHDAFRAAEGDAVEVLRKHDARARAFAQMYFDVRFLLRAAALEGYQEERDELVHALGLLRAATDGHVTLVEVEARAIASRADLAASRLRAIRADLESLHETKTEPDAEREIATKADELVELAAARDRDRDRAFAFATKLDELAKRKQLMRQSLVVETLRPRLADALAARAKVREEAQRFVDQAKLYFDEPAKGVEPSKELAKFSRPERLRIARELAARALAKDPLAEEATWIEAKTIDFFEGEVYSRPHYDRYLALRGIRAHEWRTLRDRQLTTREQDALNVVQRGDLAPGR
ncbi:MAG: hypothetical protein K8S98_15885 [Planctomycetes bacterium]|nr:hypothetical protein [Planctomycetota bacterium]